MDVGIIINPAAGVHRGGTIDARTTLAHAVLRNCGLEGEVLVTEGPGHARDLAGMLVGRGLNTVVAWGGDGTVNEVASRVAFRGPALGIVPAGSGNGLARELDLDWDPARALETAVRGPVRWIDAGELGGRLFFNVAGIGFDAHLATVFNARTRRGALGYAIAALRELAVYDPVLYAVRADQLAFEEKALIVAVANTRQYGNRAIIAPHARPDDGLLELVIIPPLVPLSALWHAHRLFAGTVHRLRGARMHSVRDAEIAGAGPLTFHVDGEVASGPSTLSVKVHPRAVPVRVPRDH